MAAIAFGMALRQRQAFSCHRLTCEIISQQPHAHSGADSKSGRQPKRNAASGLQNPFVGFHL